MSKNSKKLKAIMDEPPKKKTELKRTKKTKEVETDSDSGEDSDIEIIKKEKSSTKKTATNKPKWTDHVKEWSQKKKITYKDALKDDGCKAAWQKLKKKAK